MLLFVIVLVNETTLLLSRGKDIEGLSWNGSCEPSLSGYYVTRVCIHIINTFGFYNIECVCVSQCLLSCLCEFMLLFGQFGLSVGH